MAAAAGGPVTALGLRNALGLAEAGIAIMDNQIITGEGKERGGDKRSVDRLIQNNLDGREGTAMLGTKRGRSRRLPTPPAPREVVSLHSDHNPTTQKPTKVFEVAQGCNRRESLTRKIDSR